MKKLSGLLAAVLVFAFSATGAFAATFTDMADQPNTVKDAVAKTVALGIIEGYEDGTFGADQNLTRAEFAKIAVTASGAADTATMLEGSKPNFSDVKAGAWYTGWINASESLGIFQGDGNGKFRPNDTISNQEVITVLMRMLGYNDNLAGAWPVNYVTQANKIDMTDDVNIVASAAAKRGDVVVMLSNTLDTNLVTYDKDTDEFVNKQTTKGGQDEKTITLLDDAFDGHYVDITAFDPVTSVRDTAKQELTWNVGDVKANTAYGKSMIIDKDTTVSTNGGSLFDLKGHQGKVYYVVDGDKQYAKYIEVESYIKTVSDPVEKVENGKVVIGGTKYNSVDAPLFTENAGGKVAEKEEYSTTFDDADAKKNSKYLLYFNDDDQVYAVASDLDRTDEAYFVKSVTSSTIKLVGSGDTKNIDNDDDEILIWNGEEFVAPSTLEVGDAILKIDDDLYELTETQTGVLKSATNIGKDNEKWNIDGTSYISNDAEILDDEYETGAAAIEDIYGNTVQYLMNDNNSVSAIIVDDAIVGTKLYGIVVDGDDSTGKWSQGSLTSMTIFTAEGTTVDYDLDDDYDDEQDPTDLMGRLVEYKLNKDGEIKSLDVVDTNLMKNGAVEVKNNAYLVGSTNLTLANNVAIFEVDVDDEEVDVNLVTRAALLAEDDITPDTVEDVMMGTTLVDIPAYFVYATNTTGAARAIAYTNAGSTTRYFDVIDEYNFADADVDNGVTFVGDDNVYEVTNPTKATDDDLIIYTKSGDDITVLKAYKDKAKLAESVEVKGFVDGLITLVDDASIKPLYADGDEKEFTNIMTDSETVVYVLDSKTGKYTEGTLDDISKGDFVYVPVTDDDDYADLVIIDNYKGDAVDAAANWDFEVSFTKKVDGVNTPVDTTLTSGSTDDNKMRVVLNGSNNMPEGGTTNVTLKDSAATALTVRNEGTYFAIDAANGVAEDTDVVIVVTYTVGEDDEAVTVTKEVTITVKKAALVADAQ